VGVDEVEVDGGHEVTHASPGAVSCHTCSGSASAYAEDSTTSSAAMLARCAATSPSSATGMVSQIIPITGTSARVLAHDGEAAGDVLLRGGGLSLGAAQLGVVAAVVGHVVVGHEVSPGVSHSAKSRTLAGGYLSAPPRRWAVGPYPRCRHLCNVLIGTCR